LSFFALKIYWFQVVKTEVTDLKKVVAEYFVSQKEKSDKGFLRYQKKKC